MSKKIEEEVDFTKVECPYCDFIEKRSSEKYIYEIMSKHIKENHSVKWLEDLIEINGKKKVSVYILDTVGYKLMPDGIRVLKIAKVDAIKFSRK